MGGRRKKRDVVISGDCELLSTKNIQGEEEYDVDLPLPGGLV